MEGKGGRMKDERDTRHGGGASAGGDAGVGRDFAAEPSAQEAGLEAGDEPPGTAVVKDRVGDELVEPRVVGADEGLASVRLEDAAAGADVETGSLDHAGVDGPDDGGIDDQ